MLLSQPILIFAEHHDDPVTGLVLTKLTPELKSKGYGYFFDEIPTNMTNIYLQYLEDEEKIYMALKEEFIAHHLNIEDSNDVYLYSMILKDKMQSDDDWLGKMDIIEGNIKRHEARVSYIMFLNTLKTNDIEYKGIDSDLMVPKMSISDITNLTLLRDIQMTQAYLGTKFPVFGRIGLKHAEGIQNEILKSMSNDEAKDRFIFVYIHSKELEVSTEREYFEELVSGKTILPLETIFIDASHLPEDDVIKIINNKIQEKEMALRKYQKEEKTSFEINTLLESKNENVIEKNQVKQKNEIVKQTSSNFFKPNTERKKEKKETLAVLWSKIKPFI